MCNPGPQERDIVEAYRRLHEELQIRRDHERAKALIKLQKKNWLSRSLWAFGINRESKATIIDAEPSEKP